MRKYGKGENEERRRIRRVEQIEEERKIYESEKKYI